MDVLDAVLLLKLDELVKQEYSRLSSDLADVVSLIDAMSHHHRRHEPDAHNTGWVRDFRVLAYDVEDWLDLYALRLRLHSHVSGVRSIAPSAPGHANIRPLSSRILFWLRLVWHMLPICRVIDIELRGLKERAVQLSQRPTPMVFPSVPQRVDDPQLTTRFVNDGRLVGFDGPMEEVTKMVMGASGKAKLKIVSIVGMAGSGKTTLATAVYRQQQNCFQLHAFVSLGQKEGMVIKQALQDMLSELGDGDGEGPFEDNIDQLTSRLREILENKSYLIVVDDLWSSRGWEHIKICFPENSLRSRIITTTTNLALAMECSSGSSDCIYNIGLLSELDSKKLILDRAFGIGHGCPPHLEDSLAQITRRCGGLPIALVTVGSKMEGSFSKLEWDRLIGSRWLSSPDAEVMKQSLNRSYSDLPVHLKICLLVLSIFPENCKVAVDRLLRLCIAEGCEGIDRRDINELIRRNMVQPLSLVHGTPWCCRLHPVIHDFVVYKSKNFVTLVDDQTPTTTSSNCTVYRRLSVQSSKHDQDLISYERMDLSHIRSLTVFGQASAAPPFTKLCVLRVLDLEGCVKVCLDNLDKLLLLTYLSLKGTDVTELPATLWELRFLESLDVRSTKVKQLPPSIMGLQHSLRNLLFGQERMINSVETTTGIAEDIRHCRRLQNVATIDLREHPASFVKALGDLNDLRMLKITWSFHQCTEGAYREALLSSMAKWDKLMSLTIHCGLGCCMEFLDSLYYPPELLEKFKVTAGGFVSVPKWIQRLDSLSFLQITICKIGTDDLKILRDIPQLQILILGLDFVPREPIVIESEGFNQLLRFSVDCQCRGSLSKHVPCQGSHILSYNSAQVRQIKRVFLLVSAASRGSRR